MLLLLQNNNNPKQRIITTTSSSRCQNNNSVVKRLTTTTTMTSFWIISSMILFLLLINNCLLLSYAFTFRTRHSTRISVSLLQQQRQKQHQRRYRYNNFHLFESTSSDDDKSTTERKGEGDVDNDDNDDILYQRVFYRFSPGSDVNIHNSIVIEERCRFVPDKDNNEYIIPIGTRTIILRDGQVDDGEIGDEFFIFDIENTNNNKHNGAGNDLQIQASLVTAMYLASNPTLCSHGNILQVDTCIDNGLSVVLGCIGSAHVLGELDDNKDKDDDDIVDDILTISDKKDGLLPNKLEMITLSDSEYDSKLENAIQTVKSMGIKNVNTDVFDWRVRKARPLGGMGYKEYRTIVASDIAFTYPEVKELARTVANRLQPIKPFLNNDKDTTPLPRFVHVCPDNNRDDDIPYLRRTLERGYKMSVSTHYLKLEKLTFHIQKLQKDVPSESLLDELELELQNFKEIKYQSLIAQHHPEYSGEGSGEIFFPMETGEYDATSGSTFLEKDPSPW